jgi:hypothetical protein
MANLTNMNTTLTTPAWAGDYLNREHVVPGGAKVDAAAFTADASGKKFIQSGTVIGRTYAERLAGTAFGPALATDDEVLIVAHDVRDASGNTDVDIYRPGGVVKENFLPNFGTLAAGVLSKIRSLYQTTIGIN